MPASVMQRAEKILINISYDLRNLQTEAYRSQDDIAKRTKAAYVSQQRVLYIKPFMEALSMGAYLVVAHDPSKLMNALRIPNSNAENERKEALDLTNRISSAVSSLAVEPSNVSVQARLQQLNSGLSELTTFHSSLQSMIQTHDAALQRFQNMEGASRQGG